MRVLVTGGAGYIGTTLVPRLLARGHQVRVLDRMFWGVPHYAGMPGVELVNADVRRMPEGVLDGVDAVDHLAGFSNDPTSEYSPEANWQMNAVATETIAKLCCASGVKRFVFGSSCSLYDGVDRGEELLDEESSLHPRGAYATSKRYSEEALMREAGEASSRSSSAQATVFGVSERMRFDLVVNSFVKDALVRQRLVLHGGGRCGGRWSASKTSRMPTLPASKRPATRWRARRSTSWAKTTRCGSSPRSWPRRS